MNDGSSKLMYLRAQPRSHVRLEEERMVVGGRKGQGVTQYLQNLSMTFFVLHNSVCLILPSLSWELICTLQACELSTNPPFRWALVCDLMCLNELISSSLLNLVTFCSKNANMTLPQ